jgi:hypothetical protein
MVATLFDGPTPGLDFVERPGAIEGTYADYTSTISFAFSIDNDLRSAKIRDADGCQLLESTIADGVETTTYLGRLTVYGNPLSPTPTATGDHRAMADFANRPEAQLLQPLRDALQTHRVPRDLYAARKPAKGARKPWEASYLVGGEHVVIPTWSWWWSVAIDVWSWSGPARYQVQNDTATVHGLRRFARVWSAWSVTVTNLYSADALGVDATQL